MVGEKEKARELAHEAMNYKLFYNSVDSERVEKGKALIKKTS